MMLGVESFVDGDVTTVSIVDNTVRSEVVKALLDAADFPQQVKTRTDTARMSYRVPTVVAEKAGVLDTEDSAEPKKRAPRGPRKKAEPKPEPTLPSIEPDRTGQVDLTNVEF